MKIAYVINDYPKVSHSFIRREIQSLERLGVEVQRIALRGWSASLPDPADRVERDRTRYVLKGGVPAILMPTLLVLFTTPITFLRALHLTLKMARGSDRSIIHHLFYLSEACRIRPWLAAFEARAIHAHFGTNSTDVAMLAGILSGLPYSFTVHGPEEFMRPIGLREKIRRSAFVVAVSSFGRSQLNLWTSHSEWQKINVVHCGIESAFYEDAPPTIVAAPRFICVGRLVPEKGQFLLLEAVSRLVARGIALELVLAGDGPSRGQLEQLIRKHQLGAHVTITGWISSNEVKQGILGSRALVLPSFAEGLPVVIMEAMLLRRPVISTYIAGVPELVQHRETGWLIPAASVDALAQAMEECLSIPPDELKRMGEAGRSRAAERHSSDGQAAILADLFLAQCRRQGAYFA